MKNQSIYNIVNSSKLMDQVFDKYDIYRKTYFGSLTYDFTQSIDDYVNAPVKGSDWTAKGIYKYAEDTTATLDKEYGLGLALADDKKGICISRKSKVIEFTICPGAGGRFQLNGYTNNDTSINPLYMDFNKGSLNITIRQKDGTKKSFTSTYEAADVLTYKIECKGNSIIINGTEYTCDDMMPINNLTQMTFVAAKVLSTGDLQYIKSIRLV